MNLFRQHKNGSNERGQILPLFAVFLIVMILFVGLAVDLGFAYVTKANLSKAVDAAALRGVLNLGAANVSTIVENTFAANYGPSGREAGSPTVTVTFPVTNGNTSVNVNASTNINTFFARVLPGYQTLTVNAVAQATRAKLIMSLVLDRSGSMGSPLANPPGDGGLVALQAAVPQFVDLWSNGTDNLSMISFASNVTTNVSMTTNFQQAINSAVAGLQPNGATYALGGMQAAQAQNNSVSTTTGNWSKVVVFFTDGYANTIEDNLSCPGYPLVNYGGNAPSELDWIVFMDPVTGNTLSGSGQGGQCAYHDFINSPNPSCCSAKQFPSQQYGTNQQYTRANITAESEYRMLQLAKTMWTATPLPTTIYTIGLGTDIDDTFMQQLANDPNFSTYNSAYPAGRYLKVSSCPSSTCTTDLQTAFQAIANDILLRLTK